MEEGLDLHLAYQKHMWRLNQYQKKGYVEAAQYIRYFFSIAAPMGTLSGTTNGKRNLNFLDLGFANDILIFARSSRGIMTLLDKLIQCLGDAGVKLNLEKLC